DGNGEISRMWRLQTLHVCAPPPSLNVRLMLCSVRNSENALEAANAPSSAPEPFHSIRIFRLAVSCWPMRLSYVFGKFSAFPRTELTRRPKKAGEIVEIAQNQ